MSLMGFANLIHIVTAVCWAGGAFLTAWFITPTVAATGEAGGSFIRGLIQGTKIILYMNLASWLTILTGLYMYWVFSAGFSPAWITTSQGLALTISGLTAVAALVIGQTVSRPSSNRIAALGREIQAGGGPPTPEQAEEIGSLNNRLVSAGRWVAVLLMLTIIGMALGRRML